VLKILSGPWTRRKTNGIRDIMIGKIVNSAARQALPSGWNLTEDLEAKNRKRS
jgi:hypothetical protein